jgi:mono/diheme cytochrome c family protein
MNRVISLRLGALALCAAALSACSGSPDEPATRTHDSAAEQIARGRYLAKAADCAACHTIPGGAPFAGGVKLASPFGTFYGTNITPDPVHGIGKWSAAQFYKALHDGVAPDKQLYPAMPYTSYRTMSRADSDAIYAYLMAQKPAAVSNREPDLKFPFNVRFAVMFWNMLFLKDTLPDASTGSSADWTRGRYLANALGHCAECHTPRGVFGQMNGAKALQGSTLGRVVPAGYYACGACRPWLERRRPADILCDGNQPPGFCVWRDASGGGPEQPVPELGRSTRDVDLSARRCAFATHARATRFHRCRATGCRQDKLCRCVRGVSWT